MRVCVNLVIYNTYIYEKKQIETVCNYDFCASLHRSTLSESSNQKAIYCMMLLQLLMQE